MSFMSRFILSPTLLLACAAPVLSQSISSFSPTFGASDDPNYIIITGSGFSGRSIDVEFNGVRDLNAYANNADGTSIQTHVPVGAPLGPGPISVAVDGGSPVLSPQNFTVIGPGPYVSSFNPVTGSAGTTVTLNGAHFTGVTNVSFNGKPAQTINIQTDNSIQATAPAGVTSGPILVSSPDGAYLTTTNSTTTNFYATPGISGFSPTTGRPGTNVIVTGTNFLGATAIHFGSTVATDFTVLSNGAVRVSVPVGAQTGMIRVDAPAGGRLTTSNFVVQPTVFGFSPGFGPPTTSITITGANFLGTTSVQFNGLASPSVTGVTFGQLTATVPASATTGPITVNTTNGSSTSLTLFYVPASITGFTPTNSAPGTTVKITGNNFAGASAVTFNGQPAQSFVISNNTTIGAVVPAGVSTGPISVTTPAGTVISAGLFYAPPAIISFSPTHGLPGTNVVLTGANFLGATAVKFNGLAAQSFVVSNNTTISAIVPNNATTGPITVIAPAGTNTTAASFVLDYSSDLSLTLTNAPNPVFIGSNLVYTFVIANNGPFAAPNVVLTNTLPASVTFKSATASQGTLNTSGNPITGSLGSIPNGGQVSVTITVVPQATGTITDTATVASDYPDPAPANNTASTTATVLPLPLLSIQLSPPNQIKVSWPVALTNFGLEFKSSLGAANSWSNDPTTPVISGPDNVVTETNNGATRFYRLKK
jgi:uncharacterized repeat protein (TIGR01451 family)